MAEIKNDTNLQVLLEENFYTMEKKRINTLNIDDMVSLYKDKDLFSYYTDSLSEGLTEQERKDFTILSENSRREFLEESNTSAALSNFSVLQNTLLRAIMPRLISRVAISNKIATVPSFQIGYLTQLFKASDGTESTIPDMIHARMIEGPRFVKNITLPKNSVDLFAIAGYSKAGGTTIDRKTVLKDYVMKVIVGGTPETILVSKISKSDENGRYLEVVKGIDSTGASHTDTVFASLNRETGEFTCASVNGLVESFVIDGVISLESNIYSGVVENRYEKQVITVSDGDLINSSLPVSYIKDAKVLFDIDAYSQAVSLLGTIISQVIDQDVLRDLYNAVDFALDPTEQTIEYDASIIYNTMHTGVSRQLHNASLLDRVNRAIGIIENRIPFNGSMTYYVLANPIENSILSSALQGTYSGSLVRGGSLTNFSSVNLSNSTSGEIVVLSSKLIKPGEMLIVPKSNLDNEIVYGKWDYSQTLIESGYLNPQKPNVKNIAMLNRKAEHFFRPNAIQKIKVNNNRAE